MLTYTELFFTSKLMSFLNSIQNESKKYESPFIHYEYRNALTEDAIKEIEEIEYSLKTEYELPPLDLIG